MASGYFILSVRLAGNVSFGVLETGETAQRLKYDDNSKDKAQRREGVLKIVRSARDGWQQNYAPYRDASFRIEEVSYESGEITLISGPAHEPKPTPEAIVTAVRQRLVKVGETYNRSAKTASEENMAEWLFAGAEDWCGEAGLLNSWLTLSLAERIEMCRSVARGYYTPASV